MTTRSTIHVGDCLDVLRTMPAESIDAVVTDPPYGLAFCNHRWDYDVPSVEVWGECLRVLRPGGHLLAFAGTRTQHRMAVRIEDAGFEIRDMFAWVYATGFPKSVDLTDPMRRWIAGERLPQQPEAVDPDVYAVTGFLREARKRAGWTNKQIDDLFGTNGMAGHWTSLATQPAVPSVRQWKVLRTALGFGPEMDDLVAKLAANERPEDWGEGGGVDTRRFLESVPSKQEGKSQSWGSGLKPSLEPITLARKRPAGTLGGNILTHGTGALNIDGCRIDGRWPGNLIHDGSRDALDRFPIDNGQSVARFFFCPKTTPEDRDHGCEAFEVRGSAEKFKGARNHHPTVKPTELMRYLCRLVTPPGGVVLDPFAGSGSTGRGAVIEGFRFVGIERDQEFAELARCRIYAAETGGTSTATSRSSPQRELFDLVPKTTTGNSPASS